MSASGVARKLVLYVSAICVCVCLSGVPVWSLPPLADHDTEGHPASTPHGHRRLSGLLHAIPQRQLSQGLPLL